MKVLVYGSGPLGSLFAALLVDGGNEVSIVARGRRLYSHFDPAAPQMPEGSAEIPLDWSPI